MTNTSNEMKEKISAFNKEFNETNGYTKCFISCAYNQKTLEVKKFIPKHGYLDFNSEGAKYGLRYILGLATLLNVEEIIVKIPKYIDSNDYKNIFHKYGFESHCMASELIARTVYETTFRYNIPNPTTLFQEYQDLYFSLIDYLNSQEEEQQIKFNIEEYKHTSGLPIYIIEYNYLDGKKNGELKLNHNDKGFFLEHVSLDLKVYFNNPDSMDTFFKLLLENLWMSMM